VKTWNVTTEDGREFTGIVADDEWHARRAVFAICLGRTDMEHMTVRRA